MVIFGLKTTDDKDVVDLEASDICIAWNPGYLNQMALISNYIPDFELSSILEPITPPTDFPGFLTFLTKAVMYDGFPAFLPCKMIMQNPNIDPPGPNFLDDFRSIDDNWRDISNTRYWKLISRVIGNIDVESWTGNININTYGALGNSGNISINASNRHGALPGYTGGNIKMHSDSEFRVFSDPRDLFLDTHLLGKLTGQFSWFSSVNGIKNAPPPILIKPLNTVQVLLNMLRSSISIWFC